MVLSVIFDPVSLSYLLFALRNLRQPDAMSYLRVGFRCPMLLLWTCRQSLLRFGKDAFDELSILHSSIVDFFGFFGLEFKEFFGPIFFGFKNRGPHVLIVLLNGPSGRFSSFYLLFLVFL